MNGAAAGAAGTTALNAVAYLDMAVRGRPTSKAPEDAVEKLSDKADISIAGDKESRANRIAGLGPLAGIASGISIGALLGLSRSVGIRPPLFVSSILAASGALVGTNGPTAALGVTDPRAWVAKDWISDIVPHLAYGIVAAGVLGRLE